LTRRFAFLTPDNEAPTDTVCRALYIPDDPQWLALVNGAISELCKPENYEKVGAVTEEEASDRFVLMYRDYIESTEVCMIGAIVAMPRLDALPGFLICDGTTYNKSAYPKLWEVIDASMRTSTQFTVPDLTGKIIAMDGYDGNANHDFGEVYGAGAVTLSTFELPTHNHNTHTHFELLALGPGEFPVASLEIPGGATDNAGDGGAFAIYQPTFALRYFIKAQ